MCFNRLLTLRLTIFKPFCLVILFNGDSHALDLSRESIFVFGSTKLDLYPTKLDLHRRCWIKQQKWEKIKMHRSYEQLMNLLHFSHLDKPFDM